MENPLDSVAIALASGLPRRQVFTIIGKTILAALAIPQAVSARSRHSASLPSRQRAVGKQSGAGGSVKITTDSKGMWTAVTVSERLGGALSAAFVVQYQNPVARFIDYDGLGSVTGDRTQLSVNSADGAWLFRFPNDPRPLPAGRVAVDVIGIADYSIAEAVAPASSHEEFVSSVTAAFNPPKCPGDCTCGGSGAQSCSCGGCSVSCYAPYAACCKGGGCSCCQE